MKAINWIIDRFKEPSSYAGAGAVIMGIGMLTGQNWLILLGIVGGVVGFFLKEKGVI
tara:strand:+ start:1175 stop:1345 length:171 start_codon:yes stop_codon:yes gene_type:complete